LAQEPSRSISSFSGSVLDNHNHARHPPGCGCCHVSRPNTNAPNLSQHRYASSKSGDDDDKDENTTTSLEETPLENTATTMADQLDLGLPGALKGGKKLAIVFTCTVCNTRSAKQFTEQAYKHGVVMVLCPGCNNRHLIADNLDMFDDEKGGYSIEKGMAKIGQNVTKVTNDNVLELTLEQWVGEEKLQQVTDSIADEPNDNGKS
jgi:hypothetical protein